MFPSKGKWKEWTKRARRNGLVAARQGRALFNPYLAAEWWITQQNPIGWHSEKCLKEALIKLFIPVLSTKLSVE